MEFKMTPHEAITILQTGCCLQGCLEFFIYSIRPTELAGMQTDYPISALYNIHLEELIFEKVPVTNPGCQLMMVCSFSRC